jgi:hypothetical protein
LQQKYSLLDISGVIKNINEFSNGPHIEQPHVPFSDHFRLISGESTRDSVSETFLSDLELEPFAKFEADLLI